MNDQDFREPKYRYSFVHTVYCLAFWTFVAAFLHFFCGDKILKAIAYTRRRFWYLYGKIHEIVEGQTFIATLLALNLTHQLSFKKVSNYRIISFTKVFVPDLRLVVHGLSFTINLFVLWFFGNSVELIMHSI